jgi:hypothetical protein
MVSTEVTELLNFYSSFWGSVQHMRWSREGLDPILQLRAAIASNDWNKIWKTAVINAIVA